MKNLELKIRNATLNDLNNLILIESNSFIDGIQESDFVIKERINTFSKGFFVVCDKNSIPKGYISSEIWDYKKNINNNDFLLGHSIGDLHKNHGEELYISSMGILKSMRGKKLGSKLFNHLLENIKNDFPNVKSAILIVCDEWKNAQKIYLNSGFKEVGTIPNFFKSNTNDFADGIIMRKKL